MNREIKFRAWDKDSKKMIYDFTIHVNNTKVSFPKNDWHENKNDSYSTYYEDVMQFTGLCDCNGKEIFEGDLIKVYFFYNEEEIGLSDYKIYIVQYYENHDYPAFDLEDANGGHYCDDYNGLSALMSGDEIDHYEVIGNIYENPELLAGDYLD